MSWLRHEVTGPGRICVIFDQHKAIKVIFEYPQYDWSEKIEMVCIDIVCNIFGELIQNIS
jgi:hypothetical protein